MKILRSIVGTLFVALVSFGNISFTETKTTISSPADKVESKAETKAFAKVENKVVPVQKVSTQAKAKPLVVKKVVKKATVKKKGNGTSKLLSAPLIDPNNPPGGR